ncbi:MAG: hypothetical protein K0S47_3094 [Herbinix sp.]|jgi:uncharacterized protein YceK|nr:hypothetical protein [Herbinix sp.]
MRKMVIILLFAIVVLASGCSSKIHIPSQKKLISYLEDASYTVVEYSTIGDVSGVSRIVASNGDSILDVCYKVKDYASDNILDYYGKNYNKSYITGNIDGFVYYASDKSAWELSRIDTDIEN